MLDRKGVEHDHVPFFWTRHWDKSLHYTGSNSTFDDVFIEGDANSLEFVAYYMNKDKIVAVSAMNKSPIPMIVNQAIALGIMPSGSELKKKGKLDIDGLKKEIRSKKGQCRCKKEACCKNKSKWEWSIRFKWVILFMRKF